MKYELTALGPRLVSDAGQPLLLEPAPAAAFVTGRWGAVPHPTREVVDLAARLLDLADQVAGLGYGGRQGPEDFVVAKLSVAPELRSLAREMDRR